MWKIVLMVLAAAFLAGCETTPNKSPEEAQAEYRRTAFEKYASRMLYFHDRRTGLCFAASDLGGLQGVMTAVPCTEEVKKLLVNP